MLSSFYVVRAQEYELFNTAHDEEKYIFGFSFHIQANQLVIGYKAGGNIIDEVKFPNTAPQYLTQIYTATKYNITAGGLITRKFTRNIYLRTNPQVFISSDKSFYYTVNKNQSSLHNLPSTVFNLPLHFKYVASRDINFQSYFFVGPKVEFDLSVGSLERKNIDFVQLKYINYGYETGAGITFYLPLVNISTEFKFSNGLINILNRSSLPLSQAIKNIQTQIFSIGILFED